MSKATINELLSHPGTKIERESNIAWNIYIFSSAKNELNQNRNDPKKYRKALKQYKVAAMNLAKCTAKWF